MILVEIPSDDPTPELWEALLDLSAQRPSGWTLIGAQMVSLLGYEQGRAMHRVSGDADLLLDVRVLPGATRDFAQFLESVGYSLEGISPEGIGHRFVKASVAIDLLAPDGLRAGRTNVTTVPPARTVSVPGGTQALQRSEAVRVRINGREGVLNRPNLPGALILKARAIEVDDLPEAQGRDLAFLMALVDDPQVILDHLRRRELRHLRAVATWIDRSSSVWSAAPADLREDARGAAAFLLAASRS